MLNTIVRAGGVVVLVALAAGLPACLTPVRAVYYVEMDPAVEAQSRYRVDPVDDAVVYSREGLQVRVRHLTDAMLREGMPGPDNPYVVHSIDYRLGYRPVAFTVFEVTVVNPTFPKVLLDPEKATLVTGQGKLMESYAINRTNASGGLRNFEAYFLSQGVQTGDAQKLFLERMGRIRETIYHRNSPVFKGRTYTGRIAFPPLPPETRRVELELHDVITGFGIHDQPVESVTLRFPFAVEQGVRDSSEVAVAERR